MASRKDVIMAGFDRDVAVEERKSQKRLEDDKTLRNIDNITAMASGAEMGYNIGTGISELGTTIKDVRGKFQARREMKQGFMDRDHIKGLGKKEAGKAWRRGGVKADGTQYQSGKGERRDLLNSWDQDKLSKDDIVSMYLQGTNVTETKTTPDGTKIEVVSDDESGSNGNIGGYANVDTSPSFSETITDAVNKSGGPIGLTTNPMAGLGAAYGYLEDKAVGGLLKGFNSMKDDPNDPDDWYLGKKFNQGRKKLHSLSTELKSGTNK